MCSLFKGFQVIKGFRPKVEEYIKNAQCGNKTMPGLKNLDIMRIGDSLP
jgi:hypothetical protein